MRHSKSTGLRTFAVAFFAVFGCSAHAQPGGEADFSGVELGSEHLGGNVYIITGAVSNMTVSIGDDGAAIVDDNFGPLVPKVVAEIQSIADVPVRFVINTHHHGDHTGGNLNLRNMGATIMSTDNARTRLVNVSAEQGGPAPERALPAITFDEPTTLYFNGEEIRTVPVAPAHTDGDAFVHFVDSDVLVLGDVFLTVGYPYVRPEHSGIFSGFIDDLGIAIGMAGPNTRIVPGHGVASTRADLIEYRDMLVAIRDRVADMMAADMSLEQILSARPTADFDDRWGEGLTELPWTVDEFVTHVYNDLADG